MRTEQNGSYFAASTVVIFLPSYEMLQPFLSFTSYEKMPIELLNFLKLSKLDHGGPRDKNLHKLVDVLHLLYRVLYLPQSVT